MDILEGLLFINDNDVYKTYGAFLTEDKAGDNTNYSALLTPPKMKDYTVVSFREQDGEKLPDKLTPAFEARDVTLQFAIVGNGQAGFIHNYQAFLTLLKSGWLNIRLPQLGKTYRMYYKESTSYDQLTPLDEVAVAGKIKVKFREPVPTI
mgnify:CR=1 FL=1